MKSRLGTNSLNNFIDLLRCPQSFEDLHLEGDTLFSEYRKFRYSANDEGVYLFDENPNLEESKAQQHHYDMVSASYIHNLSYSHTEEYVSYLDQKLSQLTMAEPIGVSAEVCCGSGEAFALFKGLFSRGVGVDISTRMLAAASLKHTNDKALFIQGDATRLPLQTEAFDTVFMLGGIHHVPNRAALFTEIARILKPGGRFIWREPVSDLWLWRLIRWIVYRVAPALDHATERPLRYKETFPFLSQAKLRLENWQTFGFIGFCLFMNSDVLYFNKLFRFLPGIRIVTRIFIRADDFLSRLHGMRGRGLIVIGQARKV